MFRKQILWMLALAVFVGAALLYASRRPPAPLAPASARPELDAEPAPMEAARPTLEPESTPIAQDTELTPEDSAKLRALDEILATRNDNDPRLDTQLKSLSTAVKQRIREAYLTSPSERRNQRGTYVFLLGRQIETREDAEFMASVLAEPPCLSLEDCSHSPTHEIDEHAASGTETTLIYPQLVAIRALEIAMHNAATAPAAREALARASRSPLTPLANAAAGALGE